MNNRKLFNDKDELESSMLNFINLQKDNTDFLFINSETKESFKNEDLIVDYKEYYFSNVIAKASKTMLDCHNAKMNFKKTGTEG